MPAQPTTDHDAPPAIRLADPPRLRALIRHLQGTAIDVTPQEAFALYERNWRHVDRAALTAYEAHVIERRPGRSALSLPRQP